MCDRFISHLWLWIQSMQPLLGAAHPDLGLREIRRCRMGLCMVISVLLPSVEVDPQLRVCQHTPVLGGKVAWQLLWWLSDINDFGHFCGRRESSCRYVAIAEVETIS